MLADEINCAPAKTQSALLEAMEERQVSIDGTQHPLGDPFMVLATQKPVEYEGTYPLPEAQLIAFFKVVVGYPSEENREKEILRRYHWLRCPPSGQSGISTRHLRRRPAGHPGCDPSCYRGGGIAGYITQLANATAQPRPDPGSPRAAIATPLTAKSYAALHGRSLRHARRRQGCVAAHLPPPPDPAPRRRDRGLQRRRVMRRIIAGVPVPR